jgi:hypothetical protein
MDYKIEARTTKKGNVLIFRIYERKKLLLIPYWKFMCNQGDFDEAEKLVKNLRTINSRHT